MRPDWVIFYEDGHFTSFDGTPWEAPRTGVMIIAEANDHIGWKLSHGLDYFYYEPERGGFATCDQYGSYDHLIRAKQPCLLFGRMMSTPEWQKFFAKCKAMLGEKEGWWQVELRDGKVPE